MSGLDPYIGGEDGDWEVIGSSNPVPLEQFEGQVRDQQVNRAVQFIKAKGVRAVVVSLGAGIIVGALNKAGVETGWPVVCCALGGTEFGLRLLQKAVAGSKSNGDAKGIAVITRK